MENDKEYFVIRDKEYPMLYLHEVFYNGKKYYSLKETVDITSLVIAQSIEADELICYIHINSTTYTVLEPYPINDYIANRKVNPKANHNG